MLAESGAIVEYICHRYAGRSNWPVRPEQPTFAEYLYWMHFNNNVVGLFFAKAALRAGAHGPEADRIGGLIKRREEGYFRFLERRLGDSPYLAGPEFTCADVMVVFQLTTAVLFGGRRIDDLPNAVSYVRRIERTPPISERWRLRDRRQYPRRSSIEGCTTSGPASAEQSRQDRRLERVARIGGPRLR